MNIIKLAVIFALISSGVLVNSDMDIAAVPNFKVVEKSSNVTDRGWPTYVFLFILASLPFATTGGLNAGKCSEKGGCYKGLCWAYCGLSLSSLDWCYTTESYSQSYEYVTCEYNSDCNLCWRCAGSCTL